MENQIIIKKSELKNSEINIGGRDIVIGFSEPAFTYNFPESNLGAPLNARLISYFLPAVEIAQKQKQRPRLIIVSGIKAAIKWNASNDYERTVMLINNNIKKDFLGKAFEKFFPNVFSIVEIRDTSDFLKISDDLLRETWEEIKKTFPEKTSEIEKTFYKFRSTPANTDQLYKYALVHLFALGDVNFDWEPHNKNGYCSVGEHNELIFNEVREMALAIIKEKINKQKTTDIYIFDNLKMIIFDEEKSPPPYNGAHKSSHGKKEIDEVTYENNRSLSYYDERPRLHLSMNYLYSFINKNEFEKFWDGYKPRYMDLKARYGEAYHLDNKSK